MSIKKNSHASLVEKTVLAVFNFTADDRSCKGQMESRIIQCNTEQLLKIKDSFLSYLDSNISENKGYKEMVDDVLDALGLVWRTHGHISEIDYTYMFWI